MTGPYMKTGVPPALPGVGMNISNSVSVAMGRLRRHARVSLEVPQPVRDTSPSY
jgi:hypothetical protein